MTCRNRFIEARDMQGSRKHFPIADSGVVALTDFSRKPGLL